VTGEQKAKEQPATKEGMRYCDKTQKGPITHFVSFAYGERTGCAMVPQCCDKIRGRGWSLNVAITSPPLRPISPSSIFFIIFNKE
jgi:hypothetical protein